MHAKLPLLSGRRSRFSRSARRIVVGLVVVLCGLVALIGVMIFTSAGDGQGILSGDDVNGQRGTDANGAITNANGNTLGVAMTTTTADPAATPYAESLEELVQLLRVYAHARGVTVNSSLFTSPGAANADGGAAGKGLPSGLELPGASALRRAATQQGDQTHLNALWMLDAPETIKAEQEGYVERFIAPAQADAELTPLRVISSFYDPKSPTSLHHLAAATEQQMNDDGYATFIQRSATFYDPSHAARRGYGSEGSVFVAVPFTLADVTQDMVDAIVKRSTEAAQNGGGVGGGRPLPTPTAATRHPLDGGDDAVDAVDDPDGFREIRRTAVHCAMTVESVFLQAHHPVAVTVGTIDVVVVSGVGSAADLDFVDPKDVRIPITAETRLNLSSTRKRRYDRITCEPPNLRTGWDDASYGFSWKDNLRQRRVLVPLTKLELAAASSASATGAVQLPQVGRYATLQLYRGESYVFLLKPGSVVLPNWDIKLRLLYLRTPQHQRAVLSSRPTPAAAWQAAAAAVMKTWDAHPFLQLSSATLSAGQTQGDNAANAGGAGEGGAAANAAPGLDLFAKRLLAGFPADVASWLTEARTEPALGLWLVTPQWLLPAVKSALAEWKSLAARTDGEVAAAGEPQQQTPSLQDLFSAELLQSLLGPAAPMQTPLDVSSVSVTVPAEGSGKLLVHGSGTVTSTPQSFLASSLTEADVFRMVFLQEQRPPLPNEPITDVDKYVELNAQEGTDRGEAQAGAVLCGTSGTPMSYYATAERSLVKRAFEYCWLHHHRRELRSLAQQLVHSTEAMTVLKTVSATAAATEKKQTKAVKCSSGTTREPWYETQLRVRDGSRCLADMRYLSPSEPVLIEDAATKTVADTAEKRSAWFTASVHAGEVYGAVKAQPKAGGAAPVDADASASSSTPYVLQSAASASFLFAPAEAFFELAPEHRLRTRARTLAEQLAERRSNEAAKAEKSASAADHAQVPEAAPLDPSLQYLDSAAEDLYLTAALWTRGWNVFGVTEAVAAGDDAPSSGEAEGQGEVCAVDGFAGVSELPADIKAAQAFTQEKLWALVTAHRKAGTVFGPVTSATATTTALSTPLRRTLQAFEDFTGIQLKTVRQNWSA